MIRTLKRAIAVDGATDAEYIELTCLSTDTKPTTRVLGGSIAVEVDTGKVFFYDEAGTQWVEQFSFQG